MNSRTQLVNKIVPKPLQNIFIERSNKIRMLVRPYYREAIWYLHQPHSSLFKAFILFGWFFGLCQGFVDLIAK